MPSQEAVGNRPTTDRGQTGVDFVVGVAIFLLTTGFVFGFLPGMLAPFGEATASPLYGDRIVDDLVYDTLADGATPATLDTQCTLAFFGVTSATDCRFDTADSHREVIGLPARYEFNISVQALDGNGTRVPLYGNADGTVSRTGDTRLVTGDAVPDEYGSVTSVSRHVRVDDTDAVLVVRVW